MECPFCKADSRVLDSRTVVGSTYGGAVRRRRMCTNTDSCGQRFTTFESAEPVPRLVVKKDGSRERYSRDKVLRGMMTACEKRHISSDQLRGIVEDLEADFFVRSLEVQTSRIGEAVSEALRELDQVAYVRFASVYQEFADIREFERMLATLRRSTDKNRKATRGRGRSAQSAGENGRIDGKRLKRLAGKKNGGAARRGNGSARRDGSAVEDSVDSGSS